MTSLLNLSNRGWQFVILTCLLSAIPYYFIINKAGLDSNWPLLLMWMPGISAITLRLIHKEGLFKGMVWNPLKGFKWIIIGATVPLFIEVVAIILMVNFGLAELRDGFITFTEGMVRVTGTALLFGAAEQPWYIFIPHYLLSYFLGVVIYSILFAFGEEYGWRGYLHKHWVTDQKVKGIIVIGAIWGLWHLPGILLGHNFPAYPIVGGLLLMPITTVAFSFCFGAGFKETKIIWVPAVFHGALNVSSDISNNALNEVFINQPMEDVIWIALWVFSGFIYYVFYFKET